MHNVMLFGMLVDSYESITQEEQTKISINFKKTFKNDQQRAREIAHRLVELAFHFPCAMVWVDPHYSMAPRALPVVGLMAPSTTSLAVPHDTHAARLNITGSGT